MTDWMNRAACREACGGDGSFVNWPAPDQIPVCVQCPVRAECLDYGCSQHLYHGASGTVTYGGMVPADLWAEIKRRRAA